MRKILTFILLFPIVCQAQIPAYYSSIDFSKSGEDLKIQLRTLVTTTLTNPLEYTSSTLPDTWDAIKQSDLKDSSTTDVLLVYGYNDLDAITQNDRTRSKDSSCHTSGCNGLWNREHVFPQSLASPPMGTQFPGTGTDVHNLRAADGQANSSRGNDIFAAATGDAQSLSNGRFYPGDEWIGDVARIIMYMYLRYDTECPATAVGYGYTGESPLGDMPSVFLAWNAGDPPSQYEKDRNDIFETMQGNRNPFIDNPYLATKIWTGPPALNTWGVINTNDYIVKDKVIFYPSLTSGIIKAETSTQNELKYSVYNSLGKEVKSGILNRSIDISIHTAGFYYIRLENGQTSKVLKY